VRAEKSFDRSGRRRGSCDRCARYRGADPEPPALPNINAYAPVKQSDYSVNEGAWYSFAISDGVTCVMDRQTGGYGCSGPIPAAPGEFGQWRTSRFAGLFEF
jgi:hypothetical protein